jgi:hypothetical protein
MPALARHVIHIVICDTIPIMPSTIQARLDEPSRKALAKLVKQTGWSPSKVVREGLRVLAACYPGKGPRKIIGLGKFTSGIPDLGSNKEHMKGFGK